MRFTDLLATSLGSLRQRLFRTSLTVMGVVIGTMAVVVMLSLGLGVSSAMMEQFNTTSLKQVHVYAVPPATQPGERQMKMDNSVVDALSRYPGVVSVHPVYSAEVILRAGRYETWYTVMGLPHQALQDMEVVYAEGGPPPAGAPLSLVYGARMNEMFWDERTGEPADIDWMTALVTLTPVTDGGFGPMPPMDGPSAPEETPTPPRPITVATAGVLYEAEDVWTMESTTVFADLDALIKALQKAMPGKALPMQESPSASPERGNFLYQEFVVNTEDPSAAEDLTFALRDEGWGANSEVEWIRAMEQQMLIIQAVLGGIGFISLLVAAIGIANTMLMSVYERTKEIGIMKVLGAALGDIRKLFLIESAAIGFIGGGIGVLLSYAVSAGLNNLLAPSLGAVAADGTAARISLIPIPLALGALVGATLIGMTSGFVPAQRATRLSPLDAIRSQ